MTLQPGQVYKYYDYQFPDGSKHNKYGVVLAQAIRLENDRDDHAIVALTTSQTRHFKSREIGCHADERYPHFYFPRHTVGFLPSEHNHIDVEDLHRWGFLECESEAVFMGALDDELFQSIKDCVGQCDIPPIYRRAL